VAVSEVGLVRGRLDVVLLISFRSEKVMLCGEFKVMGGFAMGLCGCDKKVVVVFGCVLVFGHDILLELTVCMGFRCLVCFQKIRVKNSLFCNWQLVLA